MRKGYGLTFGLHTRIEARVQHVVDGIHAGNIYVNRNQIGAVVGSQPFGGEGLSGTGPKAGGPFYVRRFRKSSALACPPTCRFNRRLSNCRVRLGEANTLLPGAAWARFASRPERGGVGRTGVSGARQPATAYLAIAPGARAPRCQIC